MRRLLWPAVLGLAVVGCSSGERTGSEPVYPVTGVVSYGGQPVSGATVTFFSADKNRSAFGQTDDRGEYRLTTFALNDGAVEGTHVVTIVKFAASEPSSIPDTESEAYNPPGFGESTERTPPKAELPDRYADQTTSGLSATVATSGANQIDFSLD